LIQQHATVPYLEPNGSRLDGKVYKAVTRVDLACMSHRLL